MSILPVLPRRVQGTVRNVKHIKGQDVVVTLRFIKSLQVGSSVDVAIHRNEQLSFSTVHARVEIAQVKDTITRFPLIDARADYFTTALVSLVTIVAGVPTTGGVA